MNHPSIIQLFDLHWRYNSIVGDAALNTNNGSSSDAVLNINNGSGSDALLNINNGSGSDALLNINNGGADVSPNTNTGYTLA